MASENNESGELLSWGQRGTATATIAAGVFFDGLVKNFGDVRAVDNFSLDINPGEIVCILGPSGCGKTTLLRLAAGIEVPDQGTIKFNNLVVTGNNSFIPPEQRNVGLIFQDFALFPHLTILENVAFGLISLDKKTAHQVARLALRRVGLEKMTHRYPHNLSGGQQQRVALARSIAPRPSVLLMDEPFSGLDSRLRDFIREETLAVLRETRSTCLIVTHDAEEAMRMGDRIVVMHDGQLVQVGTSEQIYRKPKNLFVARIFSEINEIRCTINNGSFQSPFGSYRFEGETGAASGLLCIRHRGVQIVPKGQGTPGKVIQRKFLGDAAFVELAIQELERSLLARIRESEAPKVGSEVGIEIDRNEILLFPDASSKTVD